MKRIYVFEVMIFVEESNCFTYMQKTELILLLLWPTKMEHFANVYNHLISYLYILNCKLSTLHCNVVLYIGN